MWEAIEPLTLTEATRLRMLGAVTALLVDPGLAGVPNSVRTAAVVLTAKTNAATLDLELTTTELGRWIGLEAPTIRSEVRPRLQRGVAPSWDIEAEPAPDADRGRTQGIRWQVETLRRARHEGTLDDPLRLSRPEFAVLLRLVEAVFAPGWIHRDGTVTPPGLLGKRTGGGAATDRLALLLLVLSARPDGTVRLCPGAVQRRYGRAATTVARLLGCKPAGGQKVLERLVDENVVVLPDGWQGRLVVPAVREAHGRLRSARRAAGRPGGRAVGRSGSAVSVPGDQNAPQASPEAEKPQVTGSQEAVDSGSFDSPVFTPLHSGHTPVAGVCGDGAGCGGCSGSAVDGDGSRRECACAREDGPGASGPTDALGGGRSALRAEQPDSRPLSTRVARRAPRVAAVLAHFIHEPSSYQRGRLDRLVDGLLLDGEEDAEIAARLQSRLRRLATGDPEHPYRFRRDGLAWALALGLPRTPRAGVPVPCRIRGCRNLVRARATARVRCDRCELTAMEAAAAAAAPDPDTVAPPPPLDVLRAQLAIPPRPPQDVEPQQDVAGPQVPSEPADPDERLPEVVREQLAVITRADARVGRIARDAARTLYTPPSHASAPGQGPNRARVSAASTWWSATDRYADELAAHYARSAS